MKVSDGQKTMFIANKLFLNIRWNLSNKNLRTNVTKRTHANEKRA